jgi:hypothetical protein
MPPLAIEDAFCPGNGHQSTSMVVRRLVSSVSSTRYCTCSRSPTGKLGPGRLHPPRYIPHCARGGHDQSGLHTCLRVHGGQIHWRHNVVVAYINTRVCGFKGMLSLSLPLSLSWNINYPNCHLGQAYIYIYNVILIIFLQFYDSQYWYLPNIIDL